MTEPGRGNGIPTPTSVTSRAAGVLFLLGFLWLAAAMWSAHASIAGATAEGTVLISSVAIALPGIVAAAVLAGASAGLLTATHRRARRTRDIDADGDDDVDPASAGSLQADRPWARRLGLGVAAGAGCGALALGAIVLAYGTGSGLLIIAGTVAVAALVGGAAAALPLTTLAGGIAGTIGVFISGVLLNLFQTPLKSIFGAGSTIESQAQAAYLLARAGAVVSGVVAGVVAYQYLRRHSPESRWPAFLLAGMGAGILLLAAEGITLVGASSLTELVSDLSSLDRTTIGYLGSERLIQALIVGFTGGVAAVIAIGRTMSRADDSNDPDDDAEPEDLADPDDRVDDSAAEHLDLDSVRRYH